MSEDDIKWKEVAMQAIKAGELSLSGEGNVVSPHMQSAQAYTELKQCLVFLGRHPKPFPDIRKPTQVACGNCSFTWTPDWKGFLKGEFTPVFMCPVCGADYTLDDVPMEEE